MKLSESQLHTLFHSLGLDDNGHGREYRNNYCQPIDFESAVLTEIKEMIAGGLMEACHTINDGKDQYFRVTNAGRVAARACAKPLPKLTRSQKRYRDYLNLDSGISFREFLLLKRSGSLSN